MKNIFSKLVFLVFIATFAVFVYRANFSPTIVKTSASSTAIAKDIDKAKNNDISKEEVGKIVKEYLLDNPDILYDILEELQRRKSEEQNQKSSEFLKDNISKITSTGEPPFIGSIEPDITVVLFFDYNCSYCKQAHKHIKKVLEEDKKVKFVLRPMPILGEKSVHVAKVALSVHKIAPDKFSKIHDQLMEMKNISEESIKSALQSHDLDYKNVENEMNSFAIKSLINKNYDLAKNIGIKGAPSQVINGTFIPGFLEAEKYHYIFKTIRSAPDESLQLDSEKENNK